VKKWRDGRDEGYEGEENSSCGMFSLKECPSSLMFIEVFFMIVDLNFFSSSPNN
jgi:hypothetical protein